MKHWPKIGQLRQALREIPPGIHKFIGTVKLHGTNSGVRVMKDGQVIAQSRNRVLSVDSDNFGFAKFVKAREDWFRENLTVGETMYGEWCGKGIQQGVGIAEVDKMWVTFGTTDGEHFVPRVGPSSHDLGIYNVMEFPHYEVTINTESIGEAQNEMVDLVLAVENECPVAKHFGVENGCGEGIVWTPVNHSKLRSNCWFKTKGDKHSVSKVKTIKAVDPELVASASVFAEKTVTQARCLQGIGYLNEMKYEISRKSTGHFLKWISKDILMEEEDTILRSQLDWKMISKFISTSARQWFFDYLDDTALGSVMGPMS